MTVADPGFPVAGDVDLQLGLVSVKMYAKTKLPMIWNGDSVILFWAESIS